MVVPSGPLVSIVMVRPLTSIERDKRQPVGCVAHQLVTRKPKVHHTAFAARFGHRDHARFGLQLTNRFPTTLGITDLRPKDRHDGTRFSSRQRLDQLSGRHRGEKTFDFLLVGPYDLRYRLTLDQQYQKKLRLDSDHMLGNCQLRLTKLLPKLLAAILPQIML